MNRFQSHIMDIRFVQLGTTRKQFRRAKALLAKHMQDQWDASAWQRMILDDSIKQIAELIKVPNEQKTTFNNGSTIHWTDNLPQRDIVSQTGSDERIPDVSSIYTNNERKFVDERTLVEPCCPAQKTSSAFTGLRYPETYISHAPSLCKSRSTRQNVSRWSQKRMLPRR